MNGLGEIIVMNARAGGKLPLVFTVYVVVDPAGLQSAQAPGDTNSPDDVVSDEIASNLASLDYVELVAVRIKRT